MAHVRIQWGEHFYCLQSLRPSEPIEDVIRRMTSKSKVTTSYQGVTSAEVGGLKET